MNNRIKEFIKGFIKEFIKGFIKIFIKVFIIVEIILYIAFFILDCTSAYLNGANQAASYVKFASIILCMLMSLIIFIENKNRESLFIVLGMCFTLAADYYLLFTGRYIYGIISFIFVQVIYFNKLLRAEKLKIKIGFLIIIFMLWNIVMLIIKNVYALDPVTVLALLYIVVFFTNICLSGTALYKNRTIENKIFLSALILFLLCDLNVGLVNIDTAQLSFNINTGDINYILIWLFYLPSQVLLVLSAALER